MTLTQLQLLQLIAVFAAGVRGHQLTLWRTRKDSATAACRTCGCAVTVYPSLRPYVDGMALATDCGESAVRKAA